MTHLHEATQEASGFGFSEYIGSTLGTPSVALPSTISAPSVVLSSTLKAPLVVLSKLDKPTPTSLALYCVRFS